MNLVEMRMKVEAIQKIVNSDGTTIIAKWRGVELVVSSPANDAPEIAEQFSK